LNGRDWESPFLPYAELKIGGALNLIMGPQPNKSWGTAGGLP